MLVIVAVLGAGLGLLAYGTSALRSLELNTVDTRFSIRGDEKPPSDIVVVAVDEKSFEDLAQQWPFSHEDHAKVVDNLRRDRAKVIAIDIQFSDPPPTDKEAFALIDAIKRAGNVVESSTSVDDLGNGNSFNYLVPEEVLASKKRHAVNDWLKRTYRVALAWGNFPPDPGGVLRRLEHDREGLKGFAVATAE